jgi:hypothetical protein
MLNQKGSIAGITPRAGRDGVGLNPGGGSVATPAEVAGIQWNVSCRVHWFDLSFFARPGRQSRIASQSVCPKTARGLLSSPNDIVAATKFQVMARKGRKTRADRRGSRAEGRKKPGGFRRLRRVVTIQRAWMVMTLAVAVAMILALIAPLLLS